MIKSFVLAAAVTLSLPAAALAQQQEGLVNVNITDIEILRSVGIQIPANVNISNTPITVQVPVGIAAQVCGVAANVLTQQAGGQGTACTLSQSQSNQAFNNLLQRNQQDIEAQLNQLGGGGAAPAGAAAPAGGAAGGNAPPR